MNEWIKKNRLLVIVLAAIVLVVIIVVSFVSYTFSVRNDGERREQRLTQMYNQSIISLSTCIDQGRVGAEVTQQEFDSLKEILVGVTSARYVNESAADDVIGGGQLFSAVVENYPTIDQRSWQNLLTIVVGCRDEFQGTLDRTQNEARTYNEWRVTDDIFNSWIKADFPSDELKIVTAEGESFYGQAAYDRITRVVVVGEANAAFDTGELGEQSLFGED
jgi:hypothetical protein